MATSAPATEPRALRLGAHALPVTPEGFVTALAPMAAITNPAARALAREHGCGLTVTEMVSSEFLVARDRYAVEAALRAEREPDARVHVVQLFGGDPAVMAEAARTVVAHGADAVDVNMGCPARAITGRCAAGVALMREPARAAAIVRAMTRAVAVPVTVKLRAGWSDEEQNAVEVARAVVDAGAALVTVHARTKAMVHAGEARLALLAEVKRAVPVPVLGNGGVATPDDARRMARETGCDGVMVGRGALGNPWLFRALATGRPSDEPTHAERVAAMRRHVALYALHRGHERAAKEVRKHLRSYLANTRFEQWLRGRLAGLETVEHIDALLDELAAEPPVSIEA